MTYATYDDFRTRYTTRLSEAEVNSHILPYAARRLETALAPHFTVPFSADNVTARDLTVDLAYLLVLQRSREAGERTALAREVEGRLRRLAEGRAAMVTTSGDALYAENAAGSVWSDGVAPVFRLDDAHHDDGDAP